MALIVGWNAFAEQPAERSDVKISLVDDAGQESSVYTMVPAADAVKDILFRTHISPSVAYSFWTLEITNPKSKQGYRLALEGQVPSVVHWDGVFTTGGTVRPNENYYVRLLLISRDQKIMTSPLTVFSTKMGTGTEYMQMERKKMGVYVFPTGGLYYVNLKTPTTSSTHLPLMQASMRVAFGDTHSAGFIVETSPSIFTNVAVTPTGFFYSHISLFYLYRLFGDLPHPPVLPITPEYAKGKELQARLPARAYGAKSNLEMGLRLYNNVLRGFGNQTIDSVLSRQSTGLLLTAVGDRRLGTFRAHGTLEAGYSIFRGGIFMAQAKAGISYDRLEHLSPGLEFRYQLMMGSGADDPYDNVANGGPTGVMNQMLMIGMNVMFKI